MGAYLGVEISASSEVTKSSRTSGVGGDRKVEFFKFFESRTTTSIQQALVGAWLFATSESDSSIQLGYALTERESNAARRLAGVLDRGPDADGVTRVEAVGVGAVKGGDVASGRLAAVNDALRNAIRKSAGTVLIAQDARVGNEFLEEQVFSSTAGFCRAYEVLEEQEHGSYFEVRVIAEVDGDRVLEDFGQHLKVLGEPTFSFVEIMSGGAAPGGRFSPLGQRLQDDLSRAGFSFMEDEFREADYRMELRSNWSPVKHPINGRFGVQLQADLSWIELGGRSTSLISSDGRVSSFTGGGQAPRICAEQLASKELATIKRAIQTRVDDFMVNGRLVTVELRGLTAELGAELAAAVRGHPLVLDATAGYEERTGSVLELRTFIRSSDLVGLVRVAASESISVPTDLRSTRVATTQLKFQLVAN